MSGKPTAPTPKKRARAKPKPKRDWGPVFIAAFLETHLVTEASKAAGIHRDTAYARRKSDAEFARQWSDAEERSTEQLEQIAVKRAEDGSDLLLIFLLKARRPDIYREHHKHEHSGPQGGPISAEIVGVNAREAADATREFLARLAGPHS